MFQNRQTPLLLFVACWLVAAPLFAQFANRGQVVFIANNTDVVIQGDVFNDGPVTNNGHVRITGNAFNNAGAVFTNNQTLLLRGDWTNAGRYEPGSGERFVLNGGNQLVRHGGQRFGRLVIRGGGEKFLGESAVVERQLVLRRGLVTPSLSARFLLRGNAIIDSASTDSYVNGELFVEGRAARFYPVGNPDGYAPAWLEADEAATKDDLTVGMRVIRATQIQPDSSLDRVSAIRYWTMNPTGGTLAARVELSILPDEGLASLDSVVVAAFDENQKGAFRSIGQRNIGNINSLATVKSNNYANARLLAVGVMSSPDKSGLVYVPSAFAPASANNDENVFKIYGTNLEPGSLRLTIYNRWGNVVFGSRSFDQITGSGWDGRNQNTRDEAVPGVYTYTLEGGFKTGKTFRKNGTVTLIR